VQGGYGGGSGEHVYQVPSNRSRGPDFHTLDIAELYVRMAEVTARNGAQLVAFDPEPWAHTRIGHTELKPDAFVDLGTFRFYIEVDRGSEYRSQLAAKMRRYVRAYDQAEGGTFPLVVWVVPDLDRQRFVQGVVKRQAVPELFAVVLFDEAAQYLTRG